MQRPPLGSHPQRPSIHLHQIRLHRRCRHCQCDYCQWDREVDTAQIWEMDLPVPVPLPLPEWAETVDSVMSAPMGEEARRGSRGVFWACFLLAAITARTSGSLVVGRN